MGDAPYDIVYISFDPRWFGVEVDEDLHPVWTGHRDFGNPDIENGPDFLDASEAVRWWLNRGATRILLNLDGSEYLWAGVGPPPFDETAGAPRKVFSHEDPRGRPEGARAMAETDRTRTIDLDAQREKERREWTRIKLGGDLRRRRERIGISLEELARRLEVEPSWVRDIESGQTSLQVDYSQWVEIVWATRQPWPDARRTRPKPNDEKVRRFGWVDNGGGGLLRAEAAVRSWLDGDGG
jgi:hypothetical protein